MFCYKLTAINIHSSDPGSSSWNRRKEANAVLYQSCSSRLIWGDAYPRVRNDDDLPIDSDADVGTSCLVSSCLCHQHILLIRRVSYPRWKKLRKGMQIWEGIGASNAWKARERGLWWEQKQSTLLWQGGSSQNGSSWCWVLRKYAIVRSFVQLSLFV